MLQSFDPNAGMQLAVGVRYGRNREDGQIIYWHDAMASNDKIEFGVGVTKEGRVVFTPQEFVPLEEEVLGLTPADHKRIASGETRRIQVSDPESTQINPKRKTPSAFKTVTMKQRASELTEPFPDA